MRSHIRLALPAAILLLAGCNQAAPHNSGGGGGATPGPISAPPSSNAAGCPTQLTVTAADNGKTVCVAVGGTVMVTSPAAQAKNWVGLGATGGALGPVSTTPPVATGMALIAAYRAVNPGTETLNAGYRNCPPQTGAVSCHSLVEWSATVQVK